MSINEDIIQYAPFMSFVHPSFWHTFSNMKLEVDKLDENSKRIYGKFTYREDIGPVFEVEGSSFNRTPQYSPYYINVTGTIMNKNTIEDFKSIDKSSLINSVGEMLWANIRNKSWITDPNKLQTFFILSYVDLKKYTYYYWFAFPAPSQPLVYVSQRAIPLKDYFNQKQMETLTESYKKIEKKQQDFFVVVVKEDSVVVIKVSEILKSEETAQSEFDYDLSDICFGFTDSSNGLNPGWPLRIFLAALLEHCPCLAGSNINILSLRTKVDSDISNSLYFKIRIPQDVNTVQSAGWVGWERNDRGNFGPKLANMSSSMDPVKLADASSDLNIKLMKWRLVPDINLDIIKETKCLLFGAGTLGCHVARNLIAWGFRDITFVDSGRVSYSNPTRQVLFNHIDCHKGGKKKAEAAAENLKQILPSANSQSLVTHIPMPGHPIGDSMKDETIDNIKKITKAIEDHDVIFLLLDTREARWMPSLIAAHLGKIVINAALGFDSYLVIRHGSNENDSEIAPVKSAYVSGAQLGCYFCNDITAPGNSLKDRTLDQQCTVTRPGVAAIAGALAVEMLVGLLQHPLRSNAPAAYNLSEEIDKGIKPEIEGVLGLVPHSIRGFLWSYQTIIPTTMKFKQCIACSDGVINKYRTDNIDFLLKVFNDANYLEEITGLLELHLAAEMSDVLTLSDDEHEE